MRTIDEIEEEIGADISLAGDALGALDEEVNDTNISNLERWVAELRKDYEELVEAQEAAEAENEAYDKYIESLEDGIRDEACL